jgi:tripartite-type tricarboxylate transporter receptor subunit TctC
MKKRTILLGLGGTLAAGALLALTAAPVSAQTWPARPVRMIIPFPPGGTLDMVGRLLAQKLGDQLGQPFVVENRAGGNGTIGSDLVARAQPDGYTMLFNASTFVTAPMTMSQVPYSVIKDFTPVALVAKAPLSVAINRNLPVTDVQSLLAYAKAQQGKMTFAVGSIGSAGHLATELLKKSGMEYTVIPYKGTAPAFQDLIGGQIDGFIDPILGSVQHHKAGRVRVVAVTSLARVPNLPDVPAVSETIPGYEFSSWYGVWGPARLPQAIRDRLNVEVNKALQGEMKDKLTPQGLLVTPGSVADFVKFQTEDMARAQKLITEGNIRVN